MFISCLMARVIATSQLATNYIINNDRYGGGQIMQDKMQGVVANCQETSNQCGQLYISQPHIWKEKDFLKSFFNLFLFFIYFSP
jgi:hypothetical protein